MKNRVIRITFHKKLVMIFSLILLGAALLIGMLGFFIAKKSLDEKGEQILKNSVSQAMDLIEREYEHVESGDHTIEEGQEQIKSTLIGPLNPDGSRKDNNRIDLGEYGYFIIYDSNGNEVMHPTMEGTNVWNVTDPKDDTYFFVQDVISNAKQAGSFMEYNWALPYQDEIQEKITYGEYFEPWDWIVVATAYKIDFNASANQILFLMMAVIFLIFLVIIYIFNLFIKNFTRPVMQIVDGMGKLTEGKYQLVEGKNSEYEIRHLIGGYNQMVGGLEKAQLDIDKKNEEISYLAYHDDMTKLLNLYGLHNYVNENIKQGIQFGALVLLKINGLNVLNAMQGYGKGNEFIFDTANFLLHREHAFYCARSSSNEFALWTEFESKEQFEQRLKELIDCMRDYSNSKEQGKFIRHSFSVAFYKEHGGRFSELYEKASIAMKIVKEKKEDEFVVYGEYMKKELADKFALTLGISRAFSKKEFVAFYQEKRNSKTNEVVGVEVLARWNNKEGGMISPAIFLPAIHEQNFISEFTEYMLDYALSDYHKLCRKYGKEIYISINVFAPNLFNDNILKLISELLEKYQIPSEKLILEITEEIFITDIDTVKEITSNLRRLGVKISIDDFGTGYSSLKYLAEIEFDELKIDKSFIDRILTDENVYELIRIIARIAEVYDYDLVAEGVETMGQLQKLQEIGIEIIQGYLYSKPEPLDESYESGNIK